MSDDPYVYPNTTVLKNHFGITDQKMLDVVERRFSVQRSLEGVPRGLFDEAHLRAIHHHLFQDVYGWAGEFRTVELAKEQNLFQVVHYIDRGLSDVFSRLRQKRLLHGLDRKAFAREAGQIIGDLNYVHPFREGNGRTQMIFLKQLGAQAGHEIDLRRFDRKQWLEASIEAHRSEYGSMAKCIERAMRGRAPEHER